MRVLTAILMLGLLLPLAQAGEDGVAGNWKVTILEDGNQVSFWLITLESGKDGKYTGTAQALGRVPATVVSDVKISGDLLQFGLRLKNGITFDFEGKLPKAGGKKIFGTLSRGPQMIVAVLEATPAKNTQELDREILIRTPNDPRVFQAALNLIGRAKEQKLAAKDVQEWAEVALRAAENYGPRWQLDLSMKLIDALLTQEGYGAAAVETARRAEKTLDAKAPADTRLRVLTALGSALRQTGQADQAREIDERIDKLEVQGYVEYKSKAPDVKAEKFAGRKGKSSRAVLVELFTGAQCPPCVGADLAFDALPKTYDAKDVVLLQYHLHIPGPDALTNADTEARAEFYGKKVRGTPAVMFNGEAAPVGGGGREEAEDLYKEYRRGIEPLLESPASVQMQASAVRKGDKVHIKANVQDLDKPGEKVKLRIALVEDWARYKGRNGLAYHHRVVRALPGGAAGLALTKKDAEHAVVVDLDELRKTLTKYLDNFSKNEEPFPDAQRPMRMRNLSVVAFVQNDANQEVLHAVDVPVKE